MLFVKYRNEALRYFITDKNILRQLPSFIIFAAREWRLQMSDIKRWISKWPPIAITNPCTVWGPDRVRKTSSARQHCWPDFFCISERLGQDTKVQHWHKVIIFWNYFIRNYWVSCFQSHLFGFLWKCGRPKKSLSCSFLAQVMFAINENLSPLIAICNCQLSIVFRVDPFYIWGCPPQWGGNHWQKWNLQVFNSKLKIRYQNNQKGVMCDIFNLTITRFQLTRAESTAWYNGITSRSGSLGNL